MGKDTIYREDAIDATWKEPTYTDPLNVLTEVRDRIEALPPADRPQGEWIIKIDANGNTYGRCSICDMKQYAGQLNFCPDCGAKMKGADNE